MQRVQCWVAVVVLRFGQVSRTVWASAELDLAVESVSCMLWGQMYWICKLAPHSVPVVWTRCQRMLGMCIRKLVTLVHYVPLPIHPQRGLEWNALALASQGSCHWARWCCKSTVAYHWHAEASCQQALYCVWYLFALPDISLERNDVVSTPYNALVC